jgi:hypothetical protein
VRYEIWVEYKGELGHLQDQKLVEVPRFWRKKNAFRETAWRQAYSDGIASLMGRPCDVEYYVVDRWVDSDEEVS